MSDDDSPLAFKEAVARARRKFDITWPLQSDCDLDPRTATRPLRRSTADRLGRSPSVSGLGSRAGLWRPGGSRVERPLEKCADRPVTPRADAGQLADAHDSAILESGERDGKLQMRAICQRQRRRAAYAVALPPEGRLGAHHGLRCAALPLYAEPREIEACLAREIEEYLGPPDVATFGKEGAPDSQVVLRRGRRPLLGGAPRCFERGERRRRPLVPAIRGERRARLLDSREPPLLL